MAARLSTGLLNKLMDTGSFKTLFSGCFIDFYTGTQPATADAAATGTKIATMYSDGTSTGLTFEASATAGVLEKNASETWSGTTIAAGTIGYFRMREATDAGTASSSTAVRYDGAVNTSGAELNMKVTDFEVGEPIVLKTFSATMLQPA